jgi:FkbM family methyltransferase
MYQIITTVKIRGLLSYLWVRAKLRFSSNWKKVSNLQCRINNQLVNLDLKDLEQKYLAADCVREPENLIVYRAIATSKLVTNFVDIGANCGHVALSILNDYDNILLFEPNPRLANLLRKIFIYNENVIINECAIVDLESVGSITLRVPDDSSGLATLGGTNLSVRRDKVQSYEVKASTLESEMKDFSLAGSYIKIDVEGFESKIIKSMQLLIKTHRPIVGFEALSLSAALDCVHYFENYIFYCARFDFLENGGALARSKFCAMIAIIFGGGIDIIRLNMTDKIALENFSQVYAIPKEKSEEFEESIIKFVTNQPIIKLNRLRTWSTALTKEAVNNPLKSES